LFIYIIILLLPLLSALFCGFLGFYFGRFLSVFISVLIIFFSAIISLFLFFEISLSNSLVLIKCFNWIYIDILNLNFGFLFDSLTCSMLIIIC
jgi:NADH-ubiquinone oxidoreductase chain 5